MPRFNNLGVHSNCYWGFYYRILIETFLQYVLQVHLYQLTDLKCEDHACRSWGDIFSDSSFILLLVGLLVLPLIIHSVGIYLATVQIASICSDL